MGNFDCLDFENVQNVAVVKFKDPKVMDPERIEKMGQELLALLEDESNEDMIVNFENVSFFSSAAINKLIVLEKHIRARGGEIRLTNLRSIKCSKSAKTKRKRSSLCATDACLLIGLTYHTDFCHQTINCNDR